MKLFTRIAAIRRSTVACAAAALLIATSAVAALGAGTTGSVTGTVNDTVKHQALAGVKVTIVAPTGQYGTTTDAKGFFALSGVIPDTYIVSFELTGYEPIAVKGVSVFSGQSIDGSTPMTKSLSTIGRVTAHSIGGAYQPGLTQDTYTITSSQIDTAVGDPYNLSQTQLLQSLPGVSIDSSGYPVLRGGRENDQGFQFDGIDFTDPFTNSFINTLVLQRPGEVQLTPGAGNATEGNTGTGTINILPKRGSYPGFGSLDLEAQPRPFDHQLGFEYGIATSNGRLSDYMSYVGTRSFSQYGANGTPAS